MTVRQTGEVLEALQTVDGKVRQTQEVLEALQTVTGKVRQTRIVLEVLLTTEVEDADLDPCERIRRYIFRPWGIVWDRPEACMPFRRVVHGNWGPIVTVELAWEKSNPGPWATWPHQATKDWDKIQMPSPEWKTQIVGSAGRQAWAPIKALGPAAVSGVHQTMFDLLPIESVRRPVAA